MNIGLPVFAGAIEEKAKQEDNSIQEELSWIAGCAEEPPAHNQQQWITQGSLRPRALHSIAAWTPLKN